MKMKYLHTLRRTLRFSFSCNVTPREGKPCTLNPDRLPGIPSRGIKLGLGTGNAQSRMNCIISGLYHFPR